MIAYKLVKKEKSIKYILINLQGGLNLIFVY